MFDVEPNDPTVPELAAALAKAEAEESAEAQRQGAASQPAPDSATPEQPRAAQGETEQVDSTISKPGDTPNADDPQKKPEAQKPADSPAAGKESEYRKSQVRLEGGWKKLNESKTELQKQQEQLKAQQEEFAKEKREFEAQRQKSSQPGYTPEQWDEAARQWRAEADQLEEAGKFEDADERRVLARKAEARGKELRENPPPPPKTDEKALADWKAQQKEWWTKAAVDFPDVQKADSPVAQKLKAIITPGAEGYDPVLHKVIVDDPKGMYYVARLVTAETAAASVAAKDKELGELRAKVKELTEKYSIPGGGIAASVPRQKADSDKSEEELEEELRAEAAQMGQR